MPLMASKTAIVRRVRRFATRCVPSTMRVRFESVMAKCSVGTNEFSYLFKRQSLPYRWIANVQ
jgi:hypothetical protein